VIFPQSTRTVGFDPAAFNSLGVKLAARAGVRVLPVALQTNFQTNGGRIKDIGPLDRFQPVRFRFGEPMAVSGNGRDAHQACVRFITATLREWGVDANPDAPIESVR
jgi:1-acyl-sn-glycerol-3-phosphate acyltransferase